MLIRREVLERIRDGSVSLAFRRWHRPTVKTGGTLLTSIGQLRIASVTTVSAQAITARDAADAGYDDLAMLIDDLNRRKSGDIYRVEFGGLSADPRERLRESTPDAQESEAILRRLEHLDRRSTNGPWTATVLEIIASNPGVLAETLARRLKMEKLPFKARVRKLKALGLTISLPTGYRLSTRGEAVRMQSRSSAPVDAREHL